MPTDFTPLSSLAGGALIGLSAVLLMAFHGRIAGMTGIVGGLLPPLSRNWPWRLAFLAGTLLGSLAYVLVAGMPVFSITATPTGIVIGGLLVGIGVTFGAGCPSGHGICGLARFSPRSLAAVAAFMASALVTVFVIRHLM